MPAAVGPHGERLRVGFGSTGDRDPFGVEWTIARLEGSVFRELEGISALGRYEECLGEHPAGRPASGLLSSLPVRLPDADRRVVRTIPAER
jgi:hypothetical protein